MKTMVKLYARQMQLEMAGKESSAKILLDVMKDGDLGDKRLAKKAADMEVARIKKNKARLQPTTSTDTLLKAGQSQEVSTQHTGNISSLRNIHMHNHPLHFQGTLQRLLSPQSTSSHSSTTNPSTTWRHLRHSRGTSFRQTLRLPLPIWWCDLQSVHLRRESAWRDRAVVLNPYGQ